MVRPTTVSMVDNDRMLLDGLTEWFAHRTDLRLVHACGSVEELIHEEPGRADVVLLELMLRDRTDPLSNIHRLVEAGRRVLVMSSGRYADQLFAATCAGASGYLTKDHDLATLAGAIHSVAMGATAYAQVRGEPAGTRLAPRERELLLAYVSGLTMTAAARRIGVRPSTARTYLERIKKKYAGAGRPAYTKLELAARVREDGLWI